MKEQYTKKDQETIEALEGLKNVPERPQEQIARGKAAFLAEAKRIQNQPVSISPFQRLINSLTQPQPKLRLSTLTISIFFALVLLVSFSGSVYAARHSLPDQALYGYKLWLEDTRITITPKTATKINLHLDYAEERLREYEIMGLDATNPLTAELVNEFYAHANEAGSLLKSTGSNGEQESRLHELENRLNHLLMKQNSEDDLEPGEAETPEDDSSPGQENSTTPQRPSVTPIETPEPEDDEDLESEDFEDHSESEDDDEREETDEPENDEDAEDHNESPEETDEPEDPKSPEETDEPEEPDDEPDSKEDEEEHQEETPED